MQFVSNVASEVVNEVNGTVVVCTVEIDSLLRLAALEAAIRSAAMAEAVEVAPEAATKSV